MVITNKKGFDETYPTARKLAEDIEEVFNEDSREAIAKKELKQKLWQEKQLTT